MAPSTKTKTTNNDKKDDNNYNMIRKWKIIQLPVKREAKAFFTHIFGQTLPSVLSPMIMASNCGKGFRNTSFTAMNKI